MTRQLSFTKIEKELLPVYRQKMGAAESTEDVKKFFVYIVMDLLNRAYEDAIRFEYAHISLNPVKSPYYNIDTNMTSSDDFKSIWDNSDLSHIVLRFTDTAMNHYTHLLQNPAKTESKIRN
ncbi:MAG: hypothetical protein H8E41_02625 [Desulfobulbaceae bacterium]|uniref:Uncharacterized protein n=1 Tax=Candidatus Desulfobia pelagia TaxID=2841692 RepID=A0A8J6N8X0_9BACT|nr:hypothetical protein [Candidatus Desulfobia pelagia]